MPINDNMPKLTEVESKSILKAAPAVTVTATPPSQSVMTPTFIPPQKAWAGGVAGILTWIICYFLGQYTPIQIPVELQTPLSVIIGSIVAAIVPPSLRDIIANLNDTIVHIAQRDPKSNVSYVLPPVQPPPGEAATIPPAKSAGE